MSFQSATVARVLRHHRLVRLSKLSPASRQWRQSGRGYSTAGDAAHKAKQAAGGLTAEIPWLVGALAVTVPGTYWILSSGPLTTDGSLPGAKWHGDHDDEEEEEEEEDDKGEDKEADGEEKEEGGDDAEKTEGKGNEGDEEDGGDEKEGGEEKSESDDKDGEGSDDKDDSAKGESQTKRSKGKNVPGQPDEDKISEKSRDGKDAKLSEKAEIDNGDSSSKKLHVPDAKGGAKKRIESAAGKKVGEEKEGSSESASGKDPNKDDMHKKQAGLSNTDTKHPAADDSEKSRKDSGALETAKLQGTVDPNRPAR